MKTKKCCMLLALTLAVLLAVSACVQKPADPTLGGTGTSAGGQTTQSAQPPANTGKTLTIATPYAIGSLTPWISNSDGDTYVLSNVYETLVCDDTKAFLPGLAESWINEDDLTYVFKLRDNAYWQTGNGLFEEKVKVTAKDIKAVYEFVMDEKNGSTEYGDMKAYIAKIEAVDDTTLKVITSNPTALLLKALSNVKIFPMKAVETGFDLTKQPVGSGAYYFSEYKTDDQIVLTPNPDYFVKPGLDKVVFKIIPDKAVAAIALQNNEVDIVPQILGTDLQAVAAKDYLKLMPNTVGWYRYLGFNCAFEPFKDLRVRTAISKAIDFEAITEALFGNSFGAQLAVCSYGGAVPLEFEGADLDGWKAVYKFDPEDAKALLEEAGYRKGGDGFYAKDGKKLSFSIKCPTSDQNRIKFGDMSATYLKSIGIDCASQPTEWATMTSDIKEGNTEMFIMGGGSVLGGMNMLFHSLQNPTTAHRINYTDAELDQMLDRAYATVQEAERVKLLKECSMRALDNKVHAGGYFEYIQIGMNTRVQDYEKSPTLWYGLTTPFRNVTVQ